MPRPSAWSSGRSPLLPVSEVVLGPQCTSPMAPAEISSSAGPCDKWFQSRLRALDLTLTAVDNKGKLSHWKRCSALINPSADRGVAGSRSGRGGLGARGGKERGRGRGSRFWPLRCRLIMSLPVCSVKMTSERWKDPEHNKEPHFQLLWNGIILKDCLMNALSILLEFFFSLRGPLKPKYKHVKAVGVDGAAAETEHDSRRTPRMQTKPAGALHKSRGCFARASQASADA